MDRPQPALSYATPSFLPATQGQRWPPGLAAARIPERFFVPLWPLGDSLVARIRVEPRLLSIEQLRRWLEVLYVCSRGLHRRNQTLRMFMPMCILMLNCNRLSFIEYGTMLGYYWPSASLLIVSEIAPQARAWPRIKAYKEKRNAKVLALFSTFHLVPR